MILFCFYTEPSSQYIIKVKAFNNMGEGQPIYAIEKTSEESGRFISLLPLIFFSLLFVIFTFILSSSPTYFAIFRRKKKNPPLALLPSSARSPPLPSFGPFAIFLLWPYPPHTHLRWPFCQLLPAPSPPLAIFRYFPPPPRWPLLPSCAPSPLRWPFCHLSTHSLWSFCSCVERHLTFSTLIIKHGLVYPL